jgi:hypothetical protein
MTDNMLVRMGDGERVTMSADQVKEDLEAGTRDAAQRAGCSKKSRNTRADPG